MKPGSHRSWLPSTTGSSASFMGRRSPPSLTGDEAERPAHDLAGFALTRPAGPGDAAVAASCSSRAMRCAFDAAILCRIDGMAGAEHDRRHGRSGA